MGGEILFGLKLVVQQIEGGDQISWTHGKHSLRVGGEFEHDVVTIQDFRSSFRKPTVSVVP